MRNCPTCGQRTGHDLEDPSARWEERMRRAYTHLMNLQPKIAQLLPDQQPFIDVYVDLAMKELENP